jgi:hypothetical protein
MNFPNPNFISLTFTPETITHLKQIGDGYEFTRAFELNVTETLLDNSKYLEWGSMIKNREHAIRLRQFITPEQDLTNIDEIKTPFLQNKDRKYRALNQIFSIAQKNGSRPIQGKPFSILMFLPFGFGNIKIGELCRVWASFMLESPYWRENFVFLTLSTYNNKKYKKDPKITIPLSVNRGLCHRDDFDLDLKQLIVEVEKEALRNGKGLVILSGDVAKMGISLKCVDVVFLMSNNQEADDIIQKIYRALTDDPPNKKDGFIVDLDLKRIITAMFDYDLVKDKMRSNNPVLPTVEDRVKKVFELCNWGQDSFIEDHPEMDFNEIMNEIKKRVLNDLNNKILSEFDNKYKTLEVEQIKLIKENDDLYRKIRNALIYTSNGKKIPKRPIIIPPRGPNIPKPKPVPVPVPEEPVPEEPVPNPEPEESEEPVPDIQPQLSNEEIEKKIISIIKTFVNSLVIKSTEKWMNSLNLVSLLQKYKKDKQLIGGIAECNCDKNTNCTKEHDNLYETAFCELRSYAIIHTLNNTYEYDINIHKIIMTLVEDIFNNSSILVEWNIYIETLMREIKTVKSNDSKIKKGIRRTRKSKNVTRN